jgi:type IV pilus assembly PilN-like protein
VSQQINLFNPVFLKQKKHFSARTMLQGLSLIVIGAAAVYALQLYQLSTLRSQERSMRVQAQHATQQLARVSGDAQGRRATRSLEDELSRVESDLKTLQDLAGAVQAEVAGNTGGFSRYLAAFARQPVNGLWLTGFTVAGDDLELRGRALRAELLPVYIRRLGREDVLRGRGFSEVSVVARAEAPKAGAAPTDAGGPQRFVEFSLGTRDKRSTP